MAEEYELGQRSSGLPAHMATGTETSTVLVNDESAETDEDSSSVIEQGREAHDEARQKALDRRVVRKLDFILLPFLSLFFLINSLDRSNVGNAETVNFTGDAGLQPEDLNIAVACFFAFFVALQPVGAALGRRYGMVLWVPSCMLVWGCLTATHIWINAKWQLITIRICIGALEAGFYPVTVSYLSLFYTRFEFAKRLGIFYGQSALAGALGGIISFAVFAHFPHHNDDQDVDPRAWKPWQVLFLIEGGLTILIALTGYVFLPHGAGSCWFLTREENAWAELRIVKDRERNDNAAAAAAASAVASSTASPSSTRPSSAHSHREHAHHRPLKHAPSPSSAPNPYASNIHDQEEAEIDTNPDEFVPESRTLLDPTSQQQPQTAVGKTAALLTTARGLKPLDLLEAFTDWRVFYLLIMNIASAIPAAAFSVFLPIIIHGFGHFTPETANLFTAPPFIAGAVALYFFTWLSDRRRERFIPILYGLALLLVGLTAVVMLPFELAKLRYASLCILLAGSWVASPLTVAWFTGNIEEPGKRAIVLGINGWGNLAGVFSSLLFSPRFAPHYETPFFVTLGLVLAAFVGFLGFRELTVKENRRRRRILASWSERDKLLEDEQGRGPSDEGLATRNNTLYAFICDKLHIEDDDRAGRRGEHRLTFVYGL